MSLQITIELKDADLQHFIDAMQRAQTRAAHLSPQQITDAAQKLLVDSTNIQVPNFIAERLSKLKSMIAMVHDTGWGLSDEDRQHVLSALTYFADPDDVIPDHVPVLGFLDDAIMIELCQRELQHEVEAYEDFCAYRNAEALRRGEDTAGLQLKRVEWLEGRRSELMERMRKRRRESYSGQGGWQPALFKFA